LDAGAALMMDFDGTLVGIAATPVDVLPAAHLPQLLLRTRGTLRGALAIVSGRPIMDIDRYTKSTVMVVAGVHGLELRGTDGQSRFSSALHLAIPGLHGALQDLARHWPGILIEDKGPAVAVHYRQRPDAEQACRASALAAQAAAPMDVEILEGKYVMEIKRRGYDKGCAVREIMATAPFKGRHAVFIGDDITDESAFQAATALGGVAVMVGNRWPTDATYALESVGHVHAWIGNIRSADMRNANNPKD